MQKPGCFSFQVSLFFGKFWRFRPRIIQLVARHHRKIFTSLYQNFLRKLLGFACAREFLMHRNIVLHMLNVKELLAGRWEILSRSGGHDAELPHLRSVVSQVVANYKAGPYLNNR